MTYEEQQNLSELISRYKSWYYSGRCESPYVSPKQKFKSEIQEHIKKLEVKLKHG